MIELLAILAFAVLVMGFYIVLKAMLYFHVQKVEMLERVSDIREQAARDRTAADIHHGYAVTFAKMNHAYNIGILDVAGKFAQIPALNTPVPPPLPHYQAPEIADVNARTHARTHHETMEVVYRGTNKHAANQLNTTVYDINYTDNEGQTWVAAMPMLPGKKEYFLTNGGGRHKSLFAVMCKEHSCPNRVVSDVPHTEYCSDTCKNRYNHTK